MLACRVREIINRGSRMARSDGDLASSRLAFVVCAEGCLTIMSEGSKVELEVSVCVTVGEGVE